jgi:hypothetical protein
VRASLGLAAAFAVVASTTVAALALEEGQNEKEQLEACERSLCGILVGKEASGGDLQCSLQKTWVAKKIKAGVEQKKLTWGFGDVRCAVKLDARRQDMIEALTKPQHEVKLTPHAIKCDVERGTEVIPISVSMAPKLQFKDGKASKAWLGIGEVQAPAVVKGAIWTAAQLEDTFGIVHGDLIKEINTFIHERCPKRLAK